MLRCIYSGCKKILLKNMEEDKEKIIDTSLITIALSGTTGGAILGATLFGVIGGVIGGVGGTLITGYSEYSNRSQKRKKKKIRN